MIKKPSRAEIKLARARDILDSGLSLDPLPDYWRELLEETASLVRAAITAICDTD